MTKKVKEVIELLEAEGWHYIGTKGDHRKYVKAGSRRPVIIAGELNQDMSEGTYRAILREAGLK